MNQQILKLWPYNDPVYWAGKYSEFRHGGAIESFVLQWLRENNPVRCLAIPAIDGVVRHPEDQPKDKSGIKVLDFSGDTKHTEYDQLKKQDTIFGFLCSRNHLSSEDLYFPLDDATFSRGLQSVLPPLPPWEQRNPIAFWRGGFSGHPFIRGATVNALQHVPNTDVKLIKRWQWNQSVPTEFIGQEASIETYLQHKYILIIDGGVIASSHQWVLGSGAVPIFVTHPDNYWWFKEWLIDGYNCILVGYDTNLLKQKLKWLVANDDKARAIAQAAKATADRIFTPEFQQTYLRQELERLLG